MPYHIKKPSILNSSVTLYYAGNRRWVDEFAQRVQYDTETEANTLMNNPDGKNGGWTGASVVSE
jgi:hypothetical protein|tara:strand:- start:535 stop:726 length:192 start_codon:yes stop_codon:yes gene_type:complete